MYLHLNAQFWKQGYHYYIVLFVYTQRIDTSKIYCFNMSMLIQPPGNYLPEYGTAMKYKKI